MPGWSKKIESTERRHRLEPALDGRQLRQDLTACEPVRDEHDVTRTLRRRAIGDAQVPVQRIARLREHCGSVSRGAGRVSANAFYVSAGRFGCLTFSVTAWIASGSGRGIGTGRGTRGRSARSGSLGAADLPLLRRLSLSLTKSPVTTSRRPPSPLSPCWWWSTCWFFPAWGGAALWSGGQPARRSIGRKHWTPPTPMLGGRLSEWWRSALFGPLCYWSLSVRSPGRAGRGSSSTGFWALSSELPAAGRCAQLRGRHAAAGQGCPRR